MGEFPTPRRLPGACRAGHGRGERRRGPARDDDDAARRQGAGVRRRVPARLGGGAVPAPARARRERPGRAGGGAAPGLCRPHPRAPRGAIYFASNRRVRGLWQSSPPSRFIDELPEDHVEVVEARPTRGLTAVLALRREPVFGRATRRRAGNGRRRRPAGRLQRPAPPRVIEGRAIALRRRVGSIAVASGCFTRNSAGDVAPSTAPS